MLTKQHFVLFAKMLASMPEEKRKELAPEIIKMCKEANPLFKEKLFRKAANL